MPPDSRSHSTVGPLPWLACTASSPRSSSKSSASEKLRVRLTGKSTGVPGVAPSAPSGVSLTSRRRKGNALFASAIIASLLCFLGLREPEGPYELTSVDVETVKHNDARLLPAPPRATRHLK